MVQRILLFILVALCVGVLAQSNRLTNVAVLDFTGDQTVNTDQLKFLTNKFISELVSTDKYSVLNRERMGDILKEQGFQQSGACNSSECHVQMGQLLGVDYLVSGNIVRFGNEYAFHIEYVNVSTGRIEKSFDLTQEGELEEVYKDLCKDAAQKLLEVASSNPPAVRTVPADAIPKIHNSPMSIKHKVALALWGTSLAGLGTGYYFDAKGKEYDKTYDAELKALNKAGATSAYNDIQTAKTGRAVGYSVSIGSALVGLILWFLPDGGR